MSIAFRAQTSSGNANATSVAMTVPATAQAGDVAYAIIEVNGGETITDPSGWTRLHGATPGVQTLYYRKVLASGDVGSVTTWGISASEWSQGLMLVFSGVDNNTPEDVTPVYTDGGAASTSVVCPSITPVTNGCEIITIGCSTVDVTWTGPGGSWSVGPNQSKLTSYYEKQTTAGATGTMTITQNSSSAYNSATFALRPSTTMSPLGTPPFATVLKYGVS